MVTSKERPALSKEQILDTAIAVADEGGLGAVSMRTIAGRFGVTAMSLYNHVAGKDEILDGMLDRVVADIEVAEGDDWKEAIRASAVSARDVLLDHPWAPAMWLSRQGDSPAHILWSDRLLGALRKGGLAEETIFHAYHMLESQILGATLQELGVSALQGDLEALAGEFLARFSTGEYPDLVAHVEAHFLPRSDKRNGLEFALDLILEGLARNRERS